jgi:hypothetical protein
MSTTDIVTIEAVKSACGITGTQDDLWLGGVIAAVSEAVEAVTGRWWAPRSTTYYFDAPGDPYELEVPQGIVSLTYLGYATSDQPANGSGTYTEIPAASYYLDPPAQDRRAGAPAYRITLSQTGAYQFPWGWTVKRGIKATGVFGAASPRVTQIATSAVIRAFRARSSGGADYAIIGPDGGMKILRDFAPSELEELRNAFGTPMVA